MSEVRRFFGKFDWGSWRVVPGVGVDMRDTARVMVGKIVKRFRRENYLRMIFGRGPLAEIMDDFYCPGVLLSGGRQLWVNSELFRFSDFRSMLGFMATCLVDLYEKKTMRRIQELGLVTQTSSLMLMRCERAFESISGGVEFERYYEEVSGVMANHQRIRMREERARLDQMNADGVVRIIAQYCEEAVESVRRVINEGFYEKNPFGCFHLDFAVEKFRKMREKKVRMMYRPEISLSQGVSAEACVKTIMDRLEQEQKLRSIYASSYRAKELLEKYHTPMVKYFPRMMALEIDRRMFEFDDFSIMAAFMERCLVSNVREKKEGLLERREDIHKYFLAIHRDFDFKWYEMKMVESDTKLAEVKSTRIEADKLNKRWQKANQVKFDCSFRGRDDLFEWAYGFSMADISEDEREGIIYRSEYLCNRLDASAYEARQNARKARSAWEKSLKHLRSARLGVNRHKAKNEVIYPSL
ncbi:MAG: hypothetical protein Harvfovirus56_3 [Harvfovirus sp.]|uniref:Uncharacterized protein n=1 Tax=Harvfovirus sp. TaxID=2487768 RepID=A0A3G5A3C7_9VIRU|nr:MAG: hypothetical protein Harvfovirus56_3 [Harvfovirus sp.]